MDLLWWDDKRVLYSSLVYSLWFPVSYICLCLASQSMQASAGYTLCEVLLFKVGRGSQLGFWALVVWIVKELKHMKIFSIFMDENRLYPLRELESTLVGN